MKAGDVLNKNWSVNQYNTKFDGEGEGKGKTISALS
jgi:hypothetical protein